MKTSTRCVYLDNSEDPHGAIAPPIYQTATFQQPSASEFGEYDYTRSGNPTRRLLEAQLANLEDGKYACAFASGMAAITALCRLVNSGEEIIAGADLYGGTVRLLDQVLPRYGIEVRYVDTSDLDAVAESLTPRTKLILIETPSNPLLRITDINQLARLAQTVGALLAVDNSMLSPVFQQPRALGADIVLHSATKFLGGHSDVTAGAVITNEALVHERISFHQNAEGAGLSPFESWLLLRGLKTLALRVERQNASAQRIAAFLERQPGVGHVYHPSLRNHPGRSVHRQQAAGDGAVVSFTTEDQNFSARLVEATKLFRIAVSFGAVGSTISLPFHMSHASIPERLKRRLAPPTDLVRLSVGIEDAGDLIADLEQAFQVASTRCTQTNFASKVVLERQMSDGPGSAPGAVATGSVA
ncbi:MAG TPA: PLP-dependent aspartate aminotransferase family protein [Pyrinomonadaceae bacterium]|nr:PLP-dependent aspartate aminotransferase family protein [Pyrinomonadaceae bacterium]